MINLNKTDKKMPDSIFKTVAVGRAYELLRHEHFEQFKMPQPVEDEFMVHVEVETFGEDYPKPNIKYWVE